ncbi:transcriptional regulator, TetR family [Ruaniaceae bacterium KH17]|nr:transcriptional regulator, TetR family [Ruaniaceae bacterium KH17]
MVNMRSDLTAAARIRDAAIDVFGQRGFDAASVRDIAHEARVSPALVMHHFGSKDGLREHCDEYLMNEGLRLGGDVDIADSAALTAMIAAYPPDHPWLVYISRIILDGGPAGAALWDRLAAEAERALDTGSYPLQLRPELDPAAAASVATAVGLIPLAFQSHLARNLGAERLEGDAYQNVMATLMELLMSGLYEPKGDA